MDFSASLNSNKIPAIDDAPGQLQAARMPVIKAPGQVYQDPFARSFSVAIRKFHGAVTLPPK
ncbi:hypothetical protein GCM10017557_38260 [Streptomyces aurantiacus]|uniref:Uncharacterized protein n=1 Tax=Streptomyces aurantiacus TaxID=47760 RepID=A0A7G1P578_9ACTN|nr:hypothetical protein GCM10017557_38260 [Streptomyces aurantiacus]